MKARLVLVPLLALASGWFVFFHSPEAHSHSVQTAPDGRDLYLASCASCHGADAAGTERGPSLLEAGTAAVDFQLRTGRMPLADPRNQAVRKPPAFGAEEREAIVAYLGTVIEGPEVPEVALEVTDLSAGQELFVENCAACHGATGNGGAVGGEAIAPSLLHAEPIEVAEAIVSGPGQMPRFGFDAQERSDIVAFVRFVQTSEAPGGADLGGIGPVPEGFIAWVVGMTVLVVIAVALTRKPQRPARPEADDAS